MLYKEKIKFIRERSGLTQEEIANILKIKRGVYSMYETENIIIPLKHLNVFCNYFNVSIDYILGFSQISNYESSKNEIDLTISGNRLKELRKSLQLTQEKLAKELNVARTIISEYEKGNFLISTHSLYSICKKYNISADYLLSKIDSPKYLKASNKN